MLWIIDYSGSQQEGITIKLLIITIETVYLVMFIKMQDIGKYYLLLPKIRLKNILNIPNLNTIPYHEIQLKFHISIILFCF